MTSFVSCLTCVYCSSALQRAQLECAGIHFCIKEGQGKRDAFMLIPCGGDGTNCLEVECVAHSLLRARTVILSAGGVILMCY